MTLAGFLLTVGAAAMWALSTSSRARPRSEVPTIHVAFIVWSSLFPIAPLLLLACAMDGAESVQRQLVSIGWRELAIVVYLSLLSTLLGYGLWTRLLQRYATSTVAPPSLLVPVVGLLSAMLLLGESPTVVQWLGTLGVLLGMVINQLGGRWARA